MSRRLKPFHQLEGAQEAASDPTVHAALSASAGTGKTHVLTSRVLRLLLRGTPPSTILCLTFTRAGAAEMANRIGERLAYWVRLPDADLKKELFALVEDDSSPAVQRARRLFARVLEAPGGGIRIQTIHSFAQTLLASFPAEAGVTPGCRPIEGRAEAELARRTLARLLADAEAQGDEGLTRDVSALSLRLGEEGAERYLMAAARAHEAMAELGPRDGIEALLLDHLGLPAGGADEFAAVQLSDHVIDRSLFERLIAANKAWGTQKGFGIADRLSQFLSVSAGNREALLTKLHTDIVTAKGTLCQIKPKQTAADCDYADLAADFAEWLEKVRMILGASRFAALQAAGLRAGQAFAAAYDRAKRAMGVADFDDLIRWTRRLFDQPGMGDWVRYKLDQRTDHILVDEAQDTNADQWAIVDALAGEFFSGNPEAEERWRTIFMVGDYKQAIYGFQGTNPKEYERFKGVISGRAEELVEAADAVEARTREFRDLSIDASFRSSPAILEAVDALIDEVGHQAMGLAAPPNRHQPFHAHRPGRVEWWPAYDPALDEKLRDAAGDEGEEGSIDEPTRLYADAIARQVRAWLDAAPTLASTKRPLSAGDILILVRSRTELASLIVARLYAQGVPVAGIDRLHLHKPLAVKDLMAAVGFAVQPLDDLNLANVLVSPLIGWDQQTLYDLAFEREGNLWSALQRRRDERREFAEAHAILGEWLAQADYVTPARYLENILSGSLDGRRKLLRRLGEAARDPIEELVASALAFEREETPSLDRFIAWFGQGDVEVKRDPSAPADAVRVMTVHGAKGLEAPLVILADATHDPDKVGGTSSIMDLDVGEGRSVPLLRPRKDECAPLLRQALDAQRQVDAEEHWRLAYVGLTRAAERLVIAGVKPRRDVPEGSWHRKAAQALERLGASPQEVAGWGQALVWEGRAGITARSGRPRTSVEPIAVPDWLRTPAPIEARPPRPLAPSQIVADLDVMPPPTPAMREAARRGTLLHILFERLPAVAEGQRHEAALRWLERQGVDDAAARQSMADAVCAILSDPRYAALFGSGSLGEAPLAATLPDGRVIAGTVDRLCIGEDSVRVIDFKTGRQVPGSLDEVSPSHRLQIETYVEALRVIFPGRRIEAALLYTAGPSLMSIPT
ncbi:double-strand break repair helicase AddA [Sphingomonas jaspsi]|uniref:double-strand break repair helicase AddA n=1 Tax=Sphingomonas jaspsi TaxID=392409 RepID=UPI0004B43771|nr:double-strand break repair helicase AddA [Sphingomonas jaspsi]